MQSQGSKTIFRTKGATIFRTSQVFKDVGMFVGGEMFRDASGEVSTGFTKITGATVRVRKPTGIGSLAPNQLLIVNGVKTNLISRSLQNAPTNFLILRCVVM